MEIKKNKSNPHFFYISIVIPVLNEEKYIGRCLDSIFKINYPKECFEVILVDNGSTDRTIKIAKKYDVQIHIKQDVNVAAVRNCGARESKGEILAFIDGDCVVSRDWLDIANQYFSRDTIAMAGSLCKVSDESTWLGKTWDICLKKRRLKGETDRLGSGNMIIRKKIFDQINGFNECLVTGEDDDICYRIRSANYIIYSDPEIAAYHLGDDKTLREFLDKEIWRGCETFRLFLKNRGQMNLKAVVYALFFLSAIIATMSSSIYLLVTHKGFVAVLISIGLVLSLPVYLATVTAIVSKKWTFFFRFILLYFLFGVARAFAIFKLNPIK